MSRIAVAAATGLAATGLALVCAAAAPAASRPVCRPDGSLVARSARVVVIERRDGVVQACHLGTRRVRRLTIEPSVYEHEAVDVRIVTRRYVAFVQFYFAHKVDLVLRRRDGAIAWTAALPKPSSDVELRFAAPGQPGSTLVSTPGEPSTRARWR